MLSWLEFIDMSVVVALEANCRKSNLSGTDDDRFMSDDESWFDGSERDESLERE